MKYFVHFLLVFVLVINGCNPMSEHVKDDSAGLNGGFENSRNGIPVNWLIYSPRTVPDADFEIILDTTDFIEGKQSLHFKVIKCIPQTGWRAPGFTNEFHEIGRFEGPNTYKVSFWIKNHGSTYNISGGSVSQKKGDMRTLVESGEVIEQWKELEFEIDIPENQWLRMQVNVLEPGNFWIDDVRIERIEMAKPVRL